MTFAKMLRILQDVVGTSGWIGVSTGGELTLEPMGQLDQRDHRWMLSHGFVQVETYYIYRPMVRSRET